MDTTDITTLKNGTKVWYSHYEGAKTPPSLVTLTWQYRHGQKSGVNLTYPGGAITGTNIERAQRLCTPAVTSVPFGTPRPRHTICGDLVEGHEDGLNCKTCGPVNPAQVATS